MSTDGPSVIGGRYQILATLGQGGMGLVYKAYDPVLDRTIALKKMVASVVDSDERRARFYIEARAAARLNHPNIVTIYELEEHGGDVYIVMELLEGVSLAAFLQKRVPLSLAGQLTILAQIAEGLHYAHARAIVHRDIKPANLVLTTTGTAKILDFGIAQLASQAITKAGAMLGTPHYMSPEQIKDEPVDARADLFSLGAVAYELVTGHKPFNAESIAAVLMRITSASHTPVKEAAPDTAPALADIIESLLAKDRIQRPATGAALCQSLERIGEIDRIDLVAEAVRTLVGPVAADRAVYAPITPTPRPAAITPPDAQTSSLPTPPPLPANIPISVAPESETALLGAPASMPPPNVPPPIAPSASAPPANEPTTSAATPPNVPPVPSPGAAAPLVATPPLPTNTPSVPLANVPPAAAATPTTPASSTPVSKPAATASPAMLVDTGVPQARTRHGSGIALIAILGLLLVAVAGAGWWGYVSIRQVLAKRASNSTPSATSTSSTPTTPPSADARPADTRPTDARTDAPAPPSSSAAEPPPSSSSPSPSESSAPVSPPSSSEAAATPPSTPLAATPLKVDASTAPSIASTAPPPPSPDVVASPVKPRVGSNATSGERARMIEPRRTPSDVTRPAVAPEAPRDVSRDANRDEAARDQGRDQGARDTERSSAPPTDQRQPLDAGSLAAFQRGSRSGSGAFYADAPTTAAAVARITYTLEAYSDAIAKRDLEALREVRSSVTPTEAAWVKDGTTTVRFANLDVSVEGTDAVVRCRRTILSDGKPRASGAVELRLTRKPAGWIITDIR